MLFFHIRGSARVPSHRSPLLNDTSLTQEYQTETETWTSEARDDTT